jgi:hypothetical protein
MINQELKFKNTGVWTYLMFDCKDPREIENIIVRSSRKKRDYLTINAREMLMLFTLQNDDLDSLDKLQNLTKNYNDFLDRRTIYYSNIFVFEINKFHRCIMLIRGETDTTTTIQINGGDTSNLKAFQLHAYVTRKFYSNGNEFIVNDFTVDKDEKYFKHFTYLNVFDKTQVNPHDYRTWHNYREKLCSKRKNEFMFELFH